MTYPDSVRFLYALGNELQVGAKWDLARMHTLLRALGDPHGKRRFVHVAGTNGKGSTCAMIASVLRSAGLRTGLFTSPHLISPTERIQVNGTNVSEEQFSAAFDVVHAAAERLEAEGAIDAHPSYFETVTAMALLIFSGFKSPPCDVSVMEVGLGGRLDATNVVLSEVAVITPISFDHEAFLGNAISSIAAEKAGIIKPGVPVIMGPQTSEVEQIIKGRAAELDAPVFKVSDMRVENANFNARGCSFDLDGMRFECPLPGRHQIENALTGIRVCRLLTVPDEAIQHGLRETRWPGRIEYVRSRPDFVLDGAHNPAGAAALAQYIREFCQGRPVWIVYGTMRDKAITEVTSELFPRADRLILTAPNFPRALRPQAIASMVEHKDVVLAETLKDAIGIASNAPEEAVVFFTGSLFLVGEARALLLTV